jgi:hypothetical protein
VQIQITIADENGSSTRIVGVAGVNESGPGGASTEAALSRSGTLADVSAGAAPAQPGDPSMAPLAATSPLVGIDAGPAPAAFSR